MLVPERECEKAGKTLSVCRFALFNLFSHFSDFSVSACFSRVVLCRFALFNLFSHFSDSSVSACFSRLRTRNLQAEKLTNRKDVCFFGIR